MNKFSAYFNRLLCEKREFKKTMDRMKALPEEYGYVYGKIKRYMYEISKDAGEEVTAALNGLADTFECAAAEGKRVLEVTGRDVAAFSDGLMKDVKTWIKNRGEGLNREIMKKIGETEEA